MSIAGRDVIDLALSGGFSRAVLLPVEQVASHLAANPAHGFADDPRALTPGAKSVLVAAKAYPGFLAWPDGCGEVCAYYFASHKAHWALLALQKALLDQGVLADGQQRLPLKRLGVLSGFGVVGKNTLLRNALWGSRFSLHMLITDIEAATPEEAMDAHPCGNCTCCVASCPTGALSTDGVFRRDRCLRHHMMNGAIPEPFREKMQNRFLGCEICQRACPHQPNAPLLEAENPEDFSVDTLLRCDPVDLATIRKRIGTNISRPRRVLSQATIVAGNSGNAAYLPILKELSFHEDAAIAEHAKWATEKIHHST